MEWIWILLFLHGLVWLLSWVRMWCSFVSPYHFCFNWLSSRASLCKMMPWRAFLLQTTCLEELTRGDECKISLALVFWALVFLSSVYYVKKCFMSINVEKNNACFVEGQGLWIYVFRFPSKTKIFKHLLLFFFAGDCQINMLLWEIQKLFSW